jgi:hypothetical protein
MRPDIRPGATFPDYELPDHESVPGRLSEIQGDEPMILTVARSHGRSSRTRGPSSSGTSTSRSTPTPTTTR